MDDYDAVVVGASLAGCSAATILGRHGARVALLERSPDPNAYKVVCTHFIQPSATPTLRRLGLAEQIESAGGVRNRLDFWTRRGWITVRSGAEVGQPPYGYNIRRQRLDPMIRALAVSTAGVDYLPGATVTGLLGAPGERPRGVRVAIDGEIREVRARLVVGADGRDSKVAELAGLRARRSENARFCYFAHYRDLPLVTGTGTQGWNLEPGGAAAFPNDDGITVIACMPHRDELPRFRHNLERAFTRYFAQLPDGPDLEAGNRVTSIMGRLDMTNIRRTAAARGVALVGDAAQASDPLWGVGCGWALQTGEWLAERLEGAFGSLESIDRALARYRRQHWRTLAPHHYMICDYATGRRLNMMERMVFWAAARDQPTARAMHRLGGRMSSPLRVLPGIVGRAAWINARRISPPRDA